jgi:adenylylsulfate kinase
MDQKGVTLWFTGLPCSGKSTIADAVAEELKRKHIGAQRLDADIIRQHLWKELGYSKEDRDENIRRATYLANLLTKNGIIVLTSFISPYQELRDHARAEIGNFVEIYVKCPVEVCIQRDTRGMYKKALAGEIPNFTGVSDPYEEPLNPEVLIESDKESLEESVTKVMTKIKKLGYVD